MLFILYNSAMLKTLFSRQWRIATILVIIANNIAVIVTNLNSRSFAQPQPAVSPGFLHKLGTWYTSTQDVTIIPRFAPKLKCRQHKRV
jgi:hypothetical protein